MDAGLEDMRRFVSGWDKIRPEEAGPEVIIYRPTVALPSPEQVAVRKKVKWEPMRFVRCPLLALSGD
jgi:hypothetical protein